MNPRIVINATLTTVGPLSIRMPKSEGGRENAFDNFPVMTRGVDDTGNRLQTGYLPATTLRGFLRRAATLRNMRAAAEAGKPYKLPQIYSEMIGQDAESEKQAGDIDLLALRQAREANAVLDLFGSGLGIKSRLKVGHFMPAVNVLPEAFTGVRKDLDDTEEALDLMDPADLQAFASRSDNNNRRAAAAALVKQLEGQVRRLDKKGEAVPEDVARSLALAKAEEAQFKDAMGDMQNSTRTIVQHHALPAGLPLSGRLVIDAARERDLELLDHALDALSQRPLLGAHSARGCGEVAGLFQFFDAEGKLLKTVSVGGFQPAQVTRF
ncbi:hypothetical protein ACVC7V_03720 [Hydrogenophaga sp. A37]|uniref:hypothetical protein n=1 Tax=Hydrogenophaga sp. A37 TaxID=1945864 RepID=UPI000985C2EF|nr:hypothetical protein [Hydrogenophaga sp. A37]OOG86610.1 hypothetical protein B0E41_05920 [Hydrogenophaga sp. A37]